MAKLILMHPADAFHQADSEDLLSPRGQAEIVSVVTKLQQDSLNPQIIWYAADVPGAKATADSLKSVFAKASNARLDVAPSRHLDRVPVIQAENLTDCLRADEAMIVIADSQRLRAIASQVSQQPYISEFFSASAVVFKKDESGTRLTNMYWPSPVLVGGCK